MSDAQIVSLSSTKHMHCGTGWRLQMGYQYTTKVHTMGKQYSLHEMNNNFRHELVIELIGGYCSQHRSASTPTHVGPSAKENAKNDSHIHIRPKRPCTCDCYTK